MTAQIMDQVVFGERTYALSGVNGVGLFQPRAHGLEPLAFSTACYRGFHCRYSVKDSRLLLVQLNIGLDEKLSGASLAGRAARRYTVAAQELVGGKLVDTQYDPGDWLIDELSIPLLFTGSMLLGEGFIRELYVHMGFQPAWRYRTVHELFFTNGILERTHDCSAKLAEVRERILALGNPPKSPQSRDDIKRWIDACFDQRY